jgi:hypothetical protein
VRAIYHTVIDSSEKENVPILVGVFQMILDLQI